MIKYVLVPVEPTKEMIEAGLSARTCPRERYKAMVGAAPFNTTHINNQQLIDAIADLFGLRLEDRTPSVIFERVKNRALRQKSCLCSEVERLAETQTRISPRTSSYSD